MTVQAGGLPAAVNFVEKDGPEALLRAIEDALSRGASWLETLAQALSERDEQLEQDHDQAQRHSDVFFWASLASALLGGLLVLPASRWL